MGRTCRKWKLAKQKRKAPLGNPGLDRRVIVKLV